MNLQTIIANASNTAVVTQAVADINNFRCCNVLSDAGILWRDAAFDEGLGNVVPLSAPTPNACSSIVCTQACCDKDNAGFGSPC